MTLVTFFGFEVFFLLIFLSFPTSHHVVLISAFLSFFVTYKSRLGGSGYPVSFTRSSLFSSTQARVFLFFWPAWASLRSPRVTTDFSLMSPQSLVCPPPRCGEYQYRQRLRLFLHAVYRASALELFRFFFVPFLTWSGSRVCGENVFCHYFRDLPSSNKKMGVFFGRFFHSPLPFFPVREERSPSPPFLSLSA